MVTAVWAVWWTLVLVGPPALHACPTHEGASPAAAAHHASHASTASHHTSSSHHDASGHCTCLGDCCAMAIGTPAKRAEIAMAPTRFATEVLPSTRLAFAIAAVAHILPFANGPPALTSPLA